VRVLIP
jgi:hypothetical protein